MRLSSNLTKCVAMATIAAALTLVDIGQAKANLITFEDLPQTGVIFVPQGYQGFQWTGGDGTGSWVLATPNNGENFFSPHSGTNYIWSNGGTSLTMSDGLFDFNSMWVRSGEVAGTETAHGYLNGTEIFTQQFAVGTAYSQVTLNFTGINQITFDQTPFNLVVDDITVNAQPAAAPAPSSVLLLGVGGVGLIACAALRRKIKLAAA